MDRGLVIGAFVFAVSVIAIAIATAARSSPERPSVPARSEGWPRTDEPATGTIVHANPPRTLPAEAERAIAARARLEVERGVRYDATYRVLGDPHYGDVPLDRGACTDVVVRAFRAVNVDLQTLVHDDVIGAPSAYPGAGDLNVDHRRVSTMYTYLTRHALSLGSDPRDTPSFRPGDVVFFAWKKCAVRTSCSPEHVGIVSDRLGPRGLPLVLQNGGPRAAESDMLDHGTLVGHFRLHQVFHDSEGYAGISRGTWNEH